MKLIIYHEDDSTRTLVPSCGSTVVAPIWVNPTSRRESGLIKTPTSWNDQNLGHETQRDWKPSNSADQTSGRRLCCSAQTSDYNKKLNSVA
jgi:hypothetical protein